MIAIAVVGAGAWGKNHQRIPESEVWRHHHSEYQEDGAPADRSGASPPILTPGDIEVWEKSFSHIPQR